jgi:hypothetical protein
VAGTAIGNEPPARNVLSEFGLDLVLDVPDSKPALT